MRELVEKLLRQQAVVSRRLPSAIFGTGAAEIAQTLQSANFPAPRIGLWPIRSDSSPEVAMGVMAALGFLLERWPSASVYRLFAQLEGEAKDYTWTISKSQFGIDDWQLDGLDENVAIWGRLENQETRWVLEIEMESDFAADEDEEARLFRYTVADLAGIVMLLPKVAQDVMTALDIEETGVVLPGYEDAGSNSKDLSTLLGLLFHWELQLLLALWGIEWEHKQVLGDEEELLAACARCGSGFGVWVVSSAVARAMTPVFDPVGEALIPTLDDVVSGFPGSRFPAILLARGLFIAGQAQASFDLLESFIESTTDDADAWLMLGELYRQGGRLLEAADAYQRAFEADAVNAALCIRYADLLLSLNQQGLSVRDFVLVSPDEQRSKLMVIEAVEAYEAALELDPSSVDVLYRQVIQLAGLNDARLWPKFETLLRLDSAGNRVRTVVDSLYQVYDVTPAIRALSDSTKQWPKRSDLFVNLAGAYLIAEQGREAKGALEKARVLTDDPVVLADIDRLMLAADDPEFEARMGEITDLVGAGTALSPEDVDFLEAILERCPDFGEVYLLLARAYQDWHEPDAVLETLLDGQKNLPEDPDIIEMLARVLWDTGETDLAFDYLNKGLSQSPHHVPLLALTGYYLFENGQEDAAKVFLTRAEAIAPRHPALHEARVRIAKIRTE